MRVSKFTLGVNLKVLLDSTAFCNDLVTVVQLFTRHFFSICTFVFCGNVLSRIANTCIHLYIYFEPYLCREVIHGNQVKIYKCELCDSAFKHPENLRHHYYRHKDVRKECEYCGVMVKEHYLKVPHLLTMKRQWTYGPTLLPWFDHFHISTKENPPLGCALALAKRNL